MSGSQEEPWSGNPNAPKISYHEHLQEKASFAGTLITSILYGILIVVFFQCMAALLNPATRRREDIKWGVVSYTVVMFSFATVFTGTTLHIQSISFVDNREFPGVKGTLPPGPLGYQWLVRSTVVGMVNNITFFLNNWLADGLLLYRCYVIYCKSLRIIALPCFMFVASVGMGITILVAQGSGWGNSWARILLNLSVPFVSVSVSLNVLLTLMIVVRLVLHGRNIRAATGSPSGISGLYKAISAMLIESCAFYAANSLVLIGLWAAGNDASGTFMSTLAMTQVIAPLLVIKRVANQSALTSAPIVTGRTALSNTGSLGESTGGGSILPVSSTDKYKKNSSEIGVDTTLDLHWDSEA